MRRWRKRAAILSSLLLVNTLVWGTVFTRAYPAQTISLVRRIIEETPVDSLPKAEVEQEFATHDLPCDAGWISLYQFSRILTTPQKMWFLALHLDSIKWASLDTRAKIVVLVIVQPDRISILTGDYLEQVVENRDEFLDDTFETRIWSTDKDLSAVADYLSKGYEGNPQSLFGKMSEEKVPLDFSCPKKESL